jgi:hypothetical protein
VGVLDRVPLVYVALDGRAAPTDLTRRVVALEVDEHVRKATQVVLTLRDDDGALRDGVGPLREGVVLGVRWGYAGALGPPRGGVVHKLEPHHDEDTVRVEALGRERDLSVGPVRRAFRGRTLRQAVAEVARDAGLALQWDAPPGVAFEAQVLDDEHGWRWLLRVTAELGLEVTCAGGTLTVREPGVDEPAATALHFRWRNAEVLSFTTETNTRRGEGDDGGVWALFFDPASGALLDHAAGDPNTTRATLAARRLTAAAQQQAAVRDRAAEDAGTRAYVALHPDLAHDSPDAQRDAYRAARSRAATPDAPRATEDDGAMLVNLGTGDATPAGGTTPPAPRPVPVVTAADRGAAQQHLRALAEGRFRAHERRRARATARCIGLPFARRGTVVQLVGTPARDAGLWYVVGAIHRIDDGGYATELELRRDGVNGPRGARPSAAARPNVHARDGAPRADDPPAAPRPVTVRLEDGRET